MVAGDEGAGSNASISHICINTRDIQNSAFHTTLNKNNNCHHQQVELISAGKMSHTQQRPESPTVTLTWHVSEYKVYKFYQRCIL